MNLDTELAGWRQQWQSDEAVAPDLRKMVERHTRAMKWMLAADVMVTVAIGGGVLAYAIRQPLPGVGLLAACTWLFIAAAWIARLKINRGTWAPAALDTAAFMELSIRRCRARLAASRFGAGLFLIQICFCLGWIYHYSEHHQSLAAWLFFGSVAIDLVWLFAMLFFAALVWYRRKQRRQLEWLLALRGETLPVSDPR